MMPKDVPPAPEADAEVEEGAVEPPVRTPRDDWTKIAGGTTYITGEPSFPRSVYNFFDMVLKKHIISGYDNRISTLERNMMVQELLEVLALVMPLGAQGETEYEDRRKTFRRIATHMVYAEDPLLVVPILTNIVAEWIDRSRFGLPPGAKVGKWDVEPEDVFAEARARLALARDARAIQVTR